MENFLDEIERNVKIIIDRKKLENSMYVQEMNEKGDEMTLQNNENTNNT